MDNNNFNQPITKPEPRPRLKTQQSAAWVMVTIVLAVLLVIAGGCWWFFSYRSSSPTYNQIKTEVDQSVSADAGGNVAGGAQAPGSMTQNVQAGQPIAQAGQVGATNAAGTNADADAPATAGALLLNEPLKYTGTVTPGGVATLNITFYSNRRITGTIDYASGKKLDLIGSYNLADDGRSFTISMTAASPSDPAYSESWAGKSSAIKDDMAHTLSFNEIYTSKGAAMTASFALSRR